ncbi:hypothetical protein [Streptomyces sp. G45]|uniref:hypothetical protein n=1 Tax=Streptomyces sp. G45 TaxID=3406627 RepID=UPI003C27971B
MDASKNQRTTPQGDPMFEYELHQLRTAELARAAARHSLVRQALKALKAAHGRDEALARMADARTGTPRPTDGPADRYTRAA